MATAVKKKDDDVAEAPRAVKPITDIKRNYEGFKFQTWFIRLPPGIILQDLQDRPAEIWKNVQANANSALHKFDVVHIVDFDETWKVEATVGFADHQRVVLSGIRKIDLPAKSETLYSDDLYEVAWVGNGYGVLRRRDEQRVVPQSFQSPEAARVALLGLYPKRMAG